MKAFYPILFFACLFLYGCIVDEALPSQNHIIAVMENDHTRTSVTDEGIFTWTAGDKVWLQTTTGHLTGVLTSGAGTSSAEFSYGAYFDDMTGKAVSPYQSGHSISDNILNMVLSPSYELGSNLTNTNAAMFGINIDKRFEFTHLAGVMRFSFTNVPAGTDKFTITLDKKINGIFTADLTSKYPILETGPTSAESEKTITLNFDPLPSTRDIKLYIPLPIGTYESLDLALYAGDYTIWTYSNTVTNTISRKTLKLMPTVNLGGEIGGRIEGCESYVSYIDEYGINHGYGVRIGETIWAPVNCGYHETDFIYGKLYQWGRKNGQGYDGTLYDIAGNKSGTYSDTPVPELLLGPVNLWDGQYKNNNKFYYIPWESNNVSYDWCSVQNDELWNLGTEDNPVKTEYDPCPDGWRVPTYAELEGLSKNHSSWTTEDGQNGYWFSGSKSYSKTASQVFFPAGGRFDTYDGSTDYRGQYGYYMSSRTAGSNAYSFHFYNSSAGGTMLTSYYRSEAHSVRCVQDDSELIPVERIILSKYFLTLTEGMTEKLSSTVNPVNANHRSVQWWSSNPDIATVDPDGNVTAISAGIATIYVMAGMNTTGCYVEVETPVLMLDYVDEYGINQGTGVKIGETIWAPVNCGYHKSRYEYGKLYQWGRSVGTGYGPEGATSIYDGGVSASQADAYNTFFAGYEKYNYDWVYPQDDKLWNSGTEDYPEKTKYDPCPEGWRVPTSNELNELSRNKSSWTTNDAGQKGYWFSGANVYTSSAPRVFLSAAGFLANLDGNAFSRDNNGLYWSSCPYDFKSNYLNMHSTKANMNSEYRALGMSVRCVQE